MTRTVAHKCQRPENPQHNSFKLLCCGFSGCWHLCATVDSRRQFGIVAASSMRVYLLVNFCYTAAVCRRRLSPSALRHHRQSNSSQGVATDRPLTKVVIARWRTARVITSLFLPNQSQRSSFAVIGYAEAGCRRSPMTCRLL